MVYVRGGHQSDRPPCILLLVVEVSRPATRKQYITFNPSKYSFLRHDGNNRRLASRINKHTIYLLTVCHAQ